MEIRSFVPAAGHDWLLPLYDPLQKLLGGDAARLEFLERANLEPGQRVLDIGAGTGSLVVLIATHHPDVEIVALDPDPKALKRARQKCERHSIAARLDQGFSDALPYAEASFDRIFSTFMFHHLGPEEKRKTLTESRRVLKPGGTLHLLDFGGAADHSEGRIARMLHSSEHLRDNFGGRIPALMGESGFASPTELGQRSSWFGRIAHYRGSA